MPAHDALGKVTSFVLSNWAWIGGGGSITAALFHRATIRIASRWYTAFCNAAALARDNSRLERELLIQRERGDYWENSHTDLDAQFNDLRTRFEQIHQVAQDAMGKIDTLSSSYKEQHATMKLLVVDREAWIHYGRELQDSLRVNQLPFPDEPTLQAKNVNILNPESF